MNFYAFHFLMRDPTGSQAADPIGLIAVQEMQEHVQLATVEEDEKLAADVRATGRSIARRKCGYRRRSKPEPLFI